MKKFGGEEEELYGPIRDAIASSIKFLELARIDDPSLSLLLMMSNDERELARRSYL